MVTSRSQLRYLVLVLPVAAALLLLKQYRTVARQSPAVAVSHHMAGSSANATAVSGNSLPAGVRAVVSYRYLAGDRLPMASAMTTDASRLWRADAKGNSQGYTAANTGARSRFTDLNVLINLGSSTCAISQWEYACRFKGGPRNSVTLFANNVATSRDWIPVDHVACPDKGHFAATRRIASAAYRYWLISYETEGLHGSVTATAARLYDQSGTPMAPTDPSVKSTKL